MSKSPVSAAARIAFVKARWHADVVDRAEEGFRAALPGLMPNAHVDTYEVPGAFEMPLMAQKLAEAGYDAVACAALVVDGGIYRHDFVASTVVDGLMRAQLATGVPVFSVSLTPHHYQPTAEHEGFYTAHFVKKGQEAAEAVAMTLAAHAAIPGTVALEAAE